MTPPSTAELYRYMSLNYDDGNSRNSDRYAFVGKIFVESWLRGKGIELTFEKGNFMFKSTLSGVSSRV